LLIRAISTTNTPGVSERHHIGGGDRGGLGAGVDADLLVFRLGQDARDGDRPLFDRLVPRVERQRQPVAGGEAEPFERVTRSEDDLARVGGCDGFPLRHSRLLAACLDVRDGELTEEVAQQESLGIEVSIASLGLRLVEIVVGLVPRPLGSLVGGRFERLHVAVVIDGYDFRCVDDLVLNRLDALQPGDRGLQLTACVDVAGNGDHLAPHAALHQVIDQVEQGTGDQEDAAERDHSDNERQERAGDALWVGEKRALDELDGDPAEGGQAAEHHDRAAEEEQQDGERENGAVGDGHPRPEPSENLPDE
jgi:hypothetical protein